MSKFLTELDAREHTDEIWELLAPLIYESDLLKRKIIIPAGFFTDLASIPRWPLIFWIWGKRCHREGVGHDYLFRTDSIPVVSFMLANRVLLEMMDARGKPWWIRYPVFVGVCVGGLRSYHKKRVENPQI